MKSLEKELALDRDRTIAGNMPRALIVFVLASIVAGVVEWHMRPERRATMLLVAVAYLAVGILFAAGVRRYPRHATTAVVIAVNFISLSVLAYTSSMNVSSEVYVIAICSLLTGIAVLLPLGWRLQLLASATAILGYLLLLLGGRIPAVSMWHSALGMTCFVGVATLGAHVIEEHRRRHLQEALSQRALADENEKLTREARRADRAKSEFLGTLSHELRTPINAIVGYTDILMDGDFDDDDDRYDLQRRVRQQALIMLKLVQAVLDLDKIAAGKTTLDLETIHPSELFARLQAQIPRNWQKDEVELAWEIDDGCRELRTDHGKLETVLRNLVHNALKYTATGSVTVQAAPRPEGGTRFVVRDSGEGIPEEDLDHVFDKFEQGRRERRRGGGVGLGMHIVKQFTQALGGTAHIASTVGQGTEVCIDLPNHPSRD